MMVDFILALSEVLTNWPENTKLSLTQIAQQTKSPMPLVIEAMSYGLDRQLDVHEPISYKDTDRCHNNLRQRMHNELLARARYEEDVRKRTGEAFLASMDKVRVMQTQKNWRGAFRTLSYFLGSNEKNMSKDHLVLACEEAIRSGIKAEMNLQEISVWFGKCIDVILSRPSPESYHEALDVIDTYGDAVTKLGSAGQSYIQSLLQKIARPAVQLQAGQKLTEVCESLQITVDIQPLVPPSFIAF